MESLIQINIFLLVKKHQRDRQKIKGEKTSSHQHRVEGIRGRGLKLSFHIEVYAWHAGSRDHFTDQWMIGRRRRRNIIYKSSKRKVEQALLTGNIMEIQIHRKCFVLLKSKLPVSKVLKYHFYFIKNCSGKQPLLIQCFYFVLLFNLFVFFL